MKGKFSRTALKKIVLLGLPLLAGRFSYYLMSLADTAMVGRLGRDALAAVALAGLFSWIIFTFVWPVRTAVQAIVSRRVGRVEAGESLDLKEVLINGLTAGFLASFIGIIASFSAGPLLRFLKVDEALILPALEYISVIRWFLPVFGAFQSMLGFLGGIRRAREIMIATLGMNILNVGFNYVLIFGKAGFPAMGIRGAALGTMLATTATAVFLIFTLNRLGYLGKIRSFQDLRCRRTLIRDIFRQSVFISIQNIFALGIFLVYETFVGKTGVSALAATHVIFALYRVNKSIVGGFSQASAILAGNSLGAGKVEEADEVIVNCEFLSGLIGLGVMVLVLIFPGPIVSFFTTDEETIAIGIRGMRFFAPFFLIEIMGFSLEIIFSANGWPRFVLISEFTTNVLFILGATALSLFVLNKDLTWAWGSFALYQLFHALILGGGYFSKRWTKMQVE